MTPWRGSMRPGTRRGLRSAEAMSPQTAEPPGLLATLLGALLVLALLFLGMLAATGPTPEERANLADSLATGTTRPTGVRWR